jgi:UDP-glucose 4-epimerase
MSRVIPKFIRQISDGEPITIYGKDKVLDFTYIDDCVTGVMCGIELLASGQEANQTINLAYGRGNSLVTMAEYVGQALGVRPEMRLEPPRVGEVTHYVANVGKARALLGYEPQVPLEEGIPRAVKWCTEWWRAHK